MDNCPDCKRKDEALEYAINNSEGKNAPGAVMIPWACFLALKAALTPNPKEE